jgi:hypothetical protein
LGLPPEEDGTISLHTETHGRKIYFYIFHSWMLAVRNYVVVKFHEALSPLERIKFMDFVHRPVFFLKNTTFRKLELFRSPGKSTDWG